jgi:hypothetical protein
VPEIVEALYIIAVVGGWVLATILYLSRETLTEEQKTMLREAEADKMVYNSYALWGKEEAYWRCRKVMAEHQEKKYQKKVTVS